MSAPTSSSIRIPADAGRRRISTAALDELAEPRPPGGWNTLERFASSYQRSTTFFRLDAGSPGSSVGYYGTQYPRIPNFGDDEDTAVADDDEESGLLGGRGGRPRPSARTSQSSLRPGDSEDAEDHFRQFRGLGSPKARPVDDFYGSIQRGSRRSSILDTHGAPELLIKEIEDEAGNIIEVVVGQVDSMA
jgi:hypothetical protein